MMFSAVLWWSQLFSELFSAGMQLLCITTACAGIFSHDGVRCFQIIQRCFQVFQRCFQMFSAVFRCSQDAPNWSQIFYTDFQICSRSAQLFSNIHRCFQMITKVFLKRHFERKKKPNPVRNWGGPRENISRRRGESDKSRRSPKALEVWKKLTQNRRRRQGRNSP